MFTFYARLRYRLLPYIYSAAHVAHRTGLPIVRAMPLAFPDDQMGDELLGQYLFGASLHVIIAWFVSNDLHQVMAARRTMEGPLFAGWVGRIRHPSDEMRIVAALNADN